MNLRIIKYFIVITFLALSTFLAANDSIRRIDYIEKSQIKRSIDHYKRKQAKLRDSTIYNRIYQICSNKSYYTHGSDYFTKSFMQASSLLSFDLETIKANFKDGNILSSFLIRDIEHPAFYRAVEDCEYSFEQTRSLIINLVIMDIAAKVSSGLAVVKILKYLNAATNFILKRYSISKKAFYILTTSLSFMWQMTKFFGEKKPVPQKSNPAIKISSNEQLDNFLDIDSMDKDTEHESQIPLQMINLQIKSLENKEELSEQEEDYLEKLKTQHYLLQSLFNK